MIISKNKAVQGLYWIGSTLQTPRKCKEGWL